jgi:hypothetical protein
VVKVGDLAQIRIKDRPIEGKCPTIMVVDMAIMEESIHLSIIVIKFPLIQPNLQLILPSIELIPQSINYLIKARILHKPEPRLLRFMERVLVVVYYCLIKRKESRSKTEKNS